MLGQQADGLLTLQLLGHAKEGKNIGTSLLSVKDTLVARLVRQLVNLGNAKNTDTAKLQKLFTELLKALPSDANTLPKEIKAELQNLLQTSLRATGESIQVKLNSFIDHLPEEIRSRFPMESLRGDLILNAEGDSLSKLKSSLENTGVALEAKLKAAAKLLHQEPRADVNKDSAPNLDISVTKDDLTKNDLKANLLRLKQTLEEMPHAQRTVGERNLLGQVNGLLRDVETFQFLSKITDSFYTFLPIAWKELREGEIAFKKRKTDSEGTSHFCRIMLDLETFGKLLIIVLMLDGNFFVSFKAENSDFHSLLDSSTKELQDMFRTKGLSLKSVNVMDIEDYSFQQLERLESFDRIVSIRV